MPEKPNVLKDYVTVAERIEAFMAKYPDGSLQSEIVELADHRVTFRAYAYRTAADERPGVGHSSMPIPATNTMLRNSEIETAETSAWGRAIAALGFEVKRGVATSNEIENKQGESGATPPAANEPAVMRPEGRDEETFLGILTKSGVIRKGGAEGYRLERRETPDGPTFGFRLELSEPEESGGHKAIPQVLVPPPVAVPLLANLNRGDPLTLEKRTVRVKGQLYQVSHPGRQSYYRLLVQEWKDDEREIPPKEALPDRSFFGLEPPDDVPLIGEKP